MEIRVDEQKPILNYRSPDVPKGQVHGLFWRLNRGEDSFLACSALLFAVLVWAIAIFAFAAAGIFFNPLSLVLLPLSAVLCILALLQFGVSKTFPLAGLALNGLFLLCILVRAFF